MIELFPANAKTLRVAASTSASASVALPNVGGSIRVFNNGSVTAFIHISTGTAAATVPTSTAAATCTPIAAGQDTAFSIPSNEVYNISAITESSSTNLEVAVGGGI